MKALFLDLDGMMNRSGGYELFTPETLLLLCRIVRRTECRIVLNSAFKTEFDRLMQPLSARAERFCVALQESGLSLHDKTPSVIAAEIQEKYAGASGKAVAVLAYLEEHPEITCYAVLDDMALRGHGIEARYIRTDGWRGLTEEEADLVETLLNN